VVTVHAFLAILAGFATMTAIVLALTALPQRFAPQWVGDKGRPKPTYAFVNLTYSFLAAVAGGYVTAQIAALSPLTNVLALAVVVLVLGSISALQMRGQQPVWYQVVLLVLSALGVLVGGLLQLKLLGVL